METENIIDESKKSIPPAGRELAVTAIELRSDEVQDILSRPPQALIRYGISVISGVMLLLFMGSFFFRYPDIVQGEVLITTENPPVWIVAKSTGKIKELMCKDKQEVHQGDILAVIDNTASTFDVEEINRILSTILISDSVFYIPKELLTKSFELGTLQSNFSVFTKAAMNYEDFLTLNLTVQEKISLKKQIVARSIYSSDLQKLLEMKKQELTLSKSSYTRDRHLFNQKVISASDMEIAEQTYLNKRQDVQQLQTSISLQKVEFSQMKETVNKLSIQYMSEKHQLFSELNSSQRELLAAIRNWQQNYLLRASQTGIITFNTFWKENQYVNTNDKVFAIVSHHPGRLIGKIKVPSTGSGKVKIGQLVNIKVTNYPYLEYGFLQAKTSDISLVSNNEFYTVAIDFTKGLHSTVNKELKFTGELNGTAEIITENQSLMERFFTPIQIIINKTFE